MNDAPQKKIRKKAWELLAHRAYSRGEMRLKLLNIADNVPAVESELNRLEQLKLLNDDDYAYNFALSRVGRKGWGPEKIRNALMRRKVDESRISVALDRIRNDGCEDFGLADYLNKYCGKRGMPGDAKAVRALTAHLRRRGFHYDSIERVLNNMLHSE